MGKANEWERKTFWESLSDCVRSFNGRDHVCLLGNLNARVGNRRVKNIKENKVKNDLEHVSAIFNAWV